MQPFILYTQGNLIASIFEGFLNQLKIFFTVAEYNPFHNGHAYHLSAMREAGATHIAVVMSGNFVQRGETAMFEKHDRARAAIGGGADLVLELPLPWSTAPAERFAAGACRLALATGVADGFSFGCENADLSLLTGAADALLARQDEYRRNRENQSYPAFLAATLPQPLYEAVSQPNNILAVEYIRYLRQQGFSGTLVPVQRVHAAHDGDKTSETIASAALLRKKMLAGERCDSFLPPESAALCRRALESGAYIGARAEWERQWLALLRTHDKAYFCSLPFASGGLGDRLWRAVRTAQSLEAVYDAVKSKRFTHASVRRLTLHAVMGVTDDLVRADPPYLRVLARNDRGREILRAMRKKASLPVVMRHADSRALDSFSQKVYALECAAADLYHTFTHRIFPCGADMTYSLYRGGEDV